MFRHDHLFGSRTDLDALFAASSCHASKVPKGFRVGFDLFLVNHHDALDLILLCGGAVFLLVGGAFIVDRVS